MSKKPKSHWYRIAAVLWFGICAGCFMSVVGDTPEIKTVPYTFVDAVTGLFTIILSLALGYLAGLEDGK